ncbi:MAG: GatB/YqeY domain-containing protein [Patescibacteria group bacterium]
MLKEKINENLMVAMKSGDAFAVEVLRGLNAVLHNKEIEKRSKEGEDELTDEEVVEVLSREVKKRKEAVELYKQGNRPELAEKEEKEMVIIQKYLPEQMSEEEVEKVVNEQIKILRSAQNDGESSFGNVMKAVMAELKGKADGKVVSEIIKEKLQ